MVNGFSISFSSLGAKNDFMKTIRNIIRESVRRMSLPSSRSVSNKNKQLQQQQKHQILQHQHSHQGTTTMHHQGSKRPDNLPGHPLGPWTIGKSAKGKQLKSELQIRHSMDIDDRVSNSTSDTNGDIHSRSRTYSDLNVQLAGGDSLDGYPSGSQSTLASDRGAKLLHASNRPENYNSNSNLPIKDSLGSPIWKPRHAQQGFPHVDRHPSGHSVHSMGPHQPHPPSQGQPTHHHQGQQRRAHLQKSPHSVDSVFSGSAYGDYSNVIYDEGHGAVLLPNAYVEHEDTEC